MGMPSWNLTDKRLEYVRGMLAKQHTVVSIADSLGVCRQTLSAELVKAGVDAAVVRNRARLNVRSNMLSDIEMIEDPAKRFQARAVFLGMYPVDDEVEVDDVIDVDVIAEKILGELDG